MAKTLKVGCYYADINFKYRVDGYDEKIQMFQYTVISSNRLTILAGEQRTCGLNSIRVANAQRLYDYEIYEDFRIWLLS